MRKKLIEVALPLEAINVASAREKSIRHGHPSTLHLWWARRPLAAARAVIFTSLVDDPDDPQAPPEFVAACRDLPRGKNAAANDTPRQRLFDFIERLVTWEATTDEKILNTARELILLSTDGNPPPLLDPFAGGGSIPLEAQRLGLEAHASDLNPVAVMINKALIEIPPKFANQPPVNPRDRAKVGGTSHWKGASGLAADVRYYGEWMREKAWERIGHLYPECNGETVIAWLWARTVPCPNPGCGAQMPLVRSFDLSKKKGKCAWVEPHVDSNTRQISFTVKQASKGSGPEGTIGRQGGRCLACGTPASFDHIRIEGQEGRMGAQLLAIVTEGTGGRYYHSPYEAQVKVALQAEPLWKPDIPINYNPRDIRPQLYGLETYADLFTPRQLVALTTFSDLVAEARTRIQQDAATVLTTAAMPVDHTPLRDGGTGLLAYAEAVSVYLTFILDRVTDKSSSLAWWMNTAEKMAPTFSRHALPMVWDYAEMNPFCNVTSNFAASVEWVSKVIDYLPQSQLYGQVEQLDARHANMPAAIISTDPPYYDNIGYADLSDYMYIWMRRALRSVFPNTMGTMLVPKEPELIASPYRHDGDSTKAQRYFESGLREVFTRLRAFTSSEYPLTIYYAFKQQEITGQEGTASTGWETILALWDLM
ncbi:MAG: DUF1156 domain-containing protein, partial [Anaerolineales bacterium]|nr:DUF1156 domain-containing protein [Anaerolineales bacterium]